MENLKELEDFETLKKSAAKIPFSPFAKFSTILAHKDILLNGKKINKFVVWEMGYRDATALLNRTTKFKVVDCPITEERYNDTTIKFLIKMKRMENGLTV